MSFVDGSLQKPTQDSNDLRAWEMCNNMVIGWIISSLDQINTRSIMYYGTAREVWKDLEDRFGQTSAAQL